MACSACAKRAARRRAAGQTVANAGSFVDMAFGRDIANPIRTNGPTGRLYTVTALKKTVRVHPVDIASLEKSGFVRVVPVEAEKVAEKEEVVAVEPEPLLIEESEGNPAINATDSAIELALEMGIDLTDVAGSGSGGRITKKDVQNAADAILAD